RVAGRLRDRDRPARRPAHGHRGDEGSGALRRGRGVARPLDRHRGAAPARARARRGPPPGADAAPPLTDRLPNDPEPIPMAKIFVVANQKGGVGKTTTTVNLAAALARHGQRTLLVDLDPQGNATMGSGIDKRSLKRSIYQ